MSELKKNREKRNIRFLDHCLAYFLVLPFLLLNLIYNQEHPGIHERQLEYFNRHYSGPDIKPGAGPFLSKQTRSRTPTHEIFGYHPYWMGTAWQNYNYNLLTTIAFFSAEATSGGNLNNLHGWPVTGLINLAHANGVDVVLCVTLFNSTDITTLLSSPTNRQNLIDNLLVQVQSANADGVNVDFELFPASQKQNLVLFIEDLTAAFHSAIPGSQITLAMPAVDWNDAWDYNALATISDGLFIMGYDYHWGGSSTTGAVAPLTGGYYNVTWSVNDYLNKTGGQAGKLILGCPYYGIEWPATSGNAGAGTTGNGDAKVYAEAEALAQSYGKLWDSSSQTPWYRYQNPNWFQGWYDDSLSLSRKYDFALQSNLKGVGMWALGYDGSDTELWEALANKFGATAAPTTPGNLAIQNIGNGEIIINFSGAQTADRYIVLRGYLNDSTIDTLGTYSQRPIVISGLSQDETYFLKIIAANDFGYSPETEMLGVVPSTDTPGVLVVNGFDRVSGTTNTYDFIRQHGSAIHYSGLAFDAASNEAVVVESIDLNNYQVVDWILGEEGTSDNTFTTAEQDLVESYLENGGRLFVSGSEIGYDLSGQGTGNDEAFYQNYLKALYISDAAGGHQEVYSAYGVNESIFNGISDITYDNGSHGTYDVDWPDGIKPNGGAELCAKYSNVDYNSKGGAGIYFEGTFGVSQITGALVYLAVGFETIYPESKRNEIMEKILDFLIKDTTVIDDSAILPSGFEITAIYPNPSNRSVTIEISSPIEFSGTVDLILMDILGRTVVAKQFSVRSNNKLKWTWSGRLDSGRLAPSGVYFCQLKTGRKSSIRKFSLVK